ncbi:TniQ family protein [Streptomyces sp. NBC_00272]|uniref:TniQ family protein n=1 Tax=unclassified Streptomyces TaxID=2593676 RepID=UPI003FA7CFE0
MEALAHRSMVDFREILIGLGLHDRHLGLIPDHTLFLLPEEAERAAAASGVPVDQLHAMTLRQYDQHAVVLHAERRSVIRMQLWGRSGSRYCPECLRERDGRWLLRWRLPWVFACTRHGRLLAHDCPGCGHRPRHGRISVFRDTFPDQCSTALKRSGPFCRTNLSQAPTVLIPEDSPVLAAQQWIDSLLSKIEQGEVSGLKLRNIFEDLRALASWFLRRTEPGDFQAYGEYIEELCQSHQNDGQFSPNPAAVAAGSLTRAIEILRHPTLDRSVAVIRDLLGRDAESLDIMTPGAVHKKWRKHSTELQQTVWRAMDTKLSTIERLRYRSCTPQPRPPQRSDKITATRARRIPQLLWRSWTVRLLPEAGRRIISLRPALSVALLLPGWSLRRFDPLIRMLHDQEHPDVYYALSKLTRNNGEALTVLCFIADYLDDDQCPIDYARRRTTISTDLLPTKTWVDICADTNTPPGAEVRELVMRRYLYQRLTGNHHRQAPGALQVTTPAEEALLAAVPFTLTASLLEALDEYAVGYLRAKGIEEEPPVWEPPAHLGMRLPLSQEADDVQVQQAHRLICEGIRPALAATQLGVPLDYLRFIFESQPPRSRAAAAGREGSSSHTRLAAARSRRRSQKELTEEFLRREYLTRRKSIEQIGAETRLPSSIIRERLQRTGFLTLRHPGRNPIDEAWLREQYLHHARSLADIAGELGMSSTHVGRRALAMGIELRPRGGHHAVSPALLEKVPLFLRPALTDQRCWGRLLRFREAMQHRTIAEAAHCLGARQAVLSAQITRLERDLGTALYVRARPGGSLRPTQVGCEVLEALAAIEVPRK